MSRSKENEMTPTYHLPRTEWEPIATKLREADADAELVPARYMEALWLATVVASTPGLDDHERLRRVKLVLVAFAHVNTPVEVGCDE